MTDDDRTKAGAVWCLLLAITAPAVWIGMRLATVRDVTTCSEVAPLTEIADSPETPAGQEGARLVVCAARPASRLERFAAARLATVVAIAHLPDPYTTRDPEARGQFLRQLAAAYADAVAESVDPELGAWVRTIEVHYDPKGNKLMEVQLQYLTRVREAAAGVSADCARRVDDWIAWYERMRRSELIDPYRGHWAVVPSHPLLYGNITNPTICVGSRFFSRSAPDPDGKKRDMASVFGHEVMHALVAVDGLRLHDQLVTAGNVEGLTGLPGTEFVDVMEIVNEMCAANYQFGSASAPYKDTTRARLAPHLLKHPRLRDLVFEYEQPEPK